MKVFQKLIEESFVVPATTVSVEMPIEEPEKPKSSRTSKSTKSPRSSKSSKKEATSAPQPPIDIPKVQCFDC